MVCLLDGGSDPGIHAVYEGSGIADRRALWMAFVFALTAAVAGELRASCGDYLHVSRPIGTELADHAIIPQPLSHNPVFPVAPCRGPNCGRQSPTPVPPAPFPMKHRTETDASTQRVADYPSLELKSWFVDSDDDPLAGHRTGLLRPPRS